MLRITLAQLNLTVGDIEGNVTRMIATAQQAAAAQADIVVFSELSLCAYYPGDMLDEAAFLLDDARYLNVVRSYFDSMLRRSDQGQRPESLEKSPAEAQP